MYFIMPKLKEGLYALYLRRSRADVEQEALGQYETLAKHEEELTAFAKRNGYVLDEPYYKELVSGERISARKEFQKLMHKVSQGVYRGILVHDISRLGRGSAMEYGWVLFTLTSNNVLIITPTKVYDPSNEDDARYLNMEMFISNMELGNIKHRLVSGTINSVKRGCFVKPTPAFGYDRHRRSDRQWSLRPNDNEAPIVRMVFDRVIAMQSLGSIATHLNDSGIRTRSGAYWQTSRIKSIITNPVYKGYIRYGYYKHKLISDDGIHTRTLWQTNDDCLIVKGLHEPIVSEEMWSMANEVINKSAPVNKDRTIKNPLAGLLVCKKCGRPMRRYKNKVRSNGNLIEHYRHAPFVDCKARGARMSLVLDVLCDALEAVAKDLEVVIESGSYDSTEDERKTIERQIVKEENKLDKLMELYFNEAITLDEFKERRRASEELTDQLTKRLKELGQPRKSPEEIRTSIHEAIEMIRDENVDPLLKNQFLKSFIKKIEYENYTEKISRPDIHLTIYLK